MSKEIIVANWKMNPKNEREAVRLAKAIDKKGAIIAPPFIFLPAVKKALRSASLASQDISWTDAGPATGEISPAMLKNYGVKYAIIGHSERRAQGESDELINKKIKTALKHSITPVVCVGETNRDHAMKYLHAVKRQIEESFKGLTGPAFKKIVIAYEPVWAVGSDAAREATPAECTEMAIFIKKVLHDKFGAGASKNIRILYGGSVDEKNASAFLQFGGVEGLLIGRASLDPEKFNKILHFIS